MLVQQSCFSIGVLEFVQATVLAYGDVLHFRGDDPLSRVMHLADVAAATGNPLRTYRWQTGDEVDVLGRVGVWPGGVIQRDRWFPAGQGDFPHRDADIRGAAGDV